MRHPGRGPGRRRDPYTLSVSTARAGISWAARSLEEAREALGAFLDDSANIARIERVAGMLAGCFRAGGKAMICGNGGSAADAMHFAEELTGRFRADRPPLPAIACTDAGHITCTANDYGYEQVFARWVSALGRAGDVLIVLSTSGNSKNIVEAVKAAKHIKMRTAALLGRDGGVLAGACDEEWIVAGVGAAPQPDRIQEVHMLVLHTLIEGVERALHPGLYR